MNNTDYFFVLISTKIQNVFFIVHFSFIPFSLQLRRIAPQPHNLTRVKVLPLTQHPFVSLHHRQGESLLKAILLVPLYKVVEDEAEIIRLIFEKFKHSQPPAGKNSGISP